MHATISHDQTARTVLVVGGGGREHALAETLSRSPRVREVVVAPGNGGTRWPATRGRAPARCVSVLATDLDGLVALACTLQPAVVVVGPEQPLAAGLADRLREAGVPCFGPSAAAAELESSKAFAKSFMARHHIPTAPAACFSDRAAARAHVLAMGVPMVVKVSGLAGGKGTLVSRTVEETLHAIDESFGGRFGQAAETVLLEQLCVGEEVSVLAFSDGRHISVMPPARDHKRLYANDSGPNTGGMGAYAPSPALPDLSTVIDTILQPAVDGLAAEGRAFVGVLYAGLMLTDSGPVVLEFNCRFGDPEAQVLLPLLESDLLTIVEACIEGRIASCPVAWKADTAVAVVAASAGYPATAETGHPIDGLEPAQTAHTRVYQSGIRVGATGPETAGGRILSVTALGPNLRVARARAYERLDAISFPGMHIRTDIGQSHPGSATYAAAGVSLASGAEVVRTLPKVLATTHGPEVLSGVGAFGGMYSALALKGLDHPVLVASTDGVGTKTTLATQLHRIRGLGADLVHHCVNDILAQGARPLFFLDFVASEALQPARVLEVVEGIAEACKAAGCALLGGETAELPGVYRPHALELVGTMVGVVDRARVIDGSQIEEGNVLVGLGSTGLHTNGYTLARHIVDGFDLHTPRPRLRSSLADALLRPHRSYLPEVTALQAAGVSIRGLAHITGGGLPENLGRVLPDGLQARIHTSSFAPDAPPIFRWLVETGGVTQREAYRVFNMGIGMVVVVAADELHTTLHTLSSSPSAPPIWTIGSIVAQPRTNPDAPRVELRP